MKFISLTQKALLVALLASAAPILADKHEGCDHPKPAATASDKDKKDPFLVIMSPADFVTKPWANIRAQAELIGPKRGSVIGLALGMIYIYVHADKFEGPDRASFDGVKKALKQCGSSAKQTRAAVVGILSQVKFFFQDCIIGHGVKKAKKEASSCNANSGHHHDKNKAKAKDIPARGLMGKTLTCLKPFWKPVKKTAKFIKTLHKLATGNLIDIMEELGGWEDKPKCGACSH